MKKVFISYSHKDEEWKDKLVTHLEVLEKQGFFEVWDDRKIAGGDEWLFEIEKAIESANVAILMISANFLTSDFILNKEIPEFFKRKEKHGMRIMPLIVKPCAWKKVKWLNPIQALPKDGRALIRCDEGEIEEYLTHFVEEIHDIICQHKEMGADTRTETDNAVKDSPVQRIPQTGTIIHLLCNRNPEVETFRTHFINWYEKSKNKPQFYIIPGQEGECHTSLLERLRLAEIKPYLESNRKTIPPRIEHLPFQTTGDIEVDISILRNSVGKKFDENYTMESLSQLCKRLDLGKHGIIMISYHIFASCWNKTYRDLITRCIAEYSAEFQSNSEDIPLFLIFFNIKYPEPDSMNFIKKMKFKLFTKKRVQKDLKHITEDFKDSCNYFMFEELQSISQNHVNNWLLDHCSHLNAKTRLDCIKKIFKGKEKVCMADLEPVFQQIISEYEKETITPYFSH